MSDENDLVIPDVNLVIADMTEEKQETLDAHTGELRRLNQRTTEDTVRMGELLIAIKAIVGYGNFGAWLQQYFSADERQAQRFMNVALHFKSDTVSDLPIGMGALYALSAQSTPEAAREEAIQLAQGGERVTQSRAQELVKAHKEDIWKDETPPFIEDPADMTEHSNHDHADEGERANHEQAGHEHDDDEHDHQHDWENEGWGEGDFGDDDDETDETDETVIIEHSEQQPWGEAQLVQTKVHPVMLSLEVETRGRWNTWKQENEFKSDDDAFLELLDAVGF